MTRRIKKAALIAGGIALFLVLLYLGLAVYISLNGHVLKNKLSEKIRERTKGEVIIGSISPAFFKTFPFISVEINQLTLRDSAYNIHKIDLLKVDKAYLRISLFKLLSDVKMNRIILKNGQLNLFTDTTGYSNTYLFKTADKENGKVQKPSAAAYPQIEMINILIDFKHPSRNKHHKILAKHLVGDIEHDENMLAIEARTSFFIHELAFNTNKGGYLTKTSWNSRLKFSYNKKTRLLRFKNQEIKLNNNNYVFSGEFSTKPADPVFFLNVQSVNTTYSEAAALLPKRISEKLTAYDIDGVISVNATIRGKTKHKFKPLVTVNISVPDATVKTNFISLSDCSFTGSFSNELVPGLERNDSNSIVRITKLKGHLGKIDIRMDSLWIYNLKSPQLKGTLHSDFNLVDLNEHTGSTTLKFTGGKAGVHIYYNGPIEKSESRSAGVYGKIDMRNASFVYLPRAFEMNDANGTILLQKNDLQVRSLKLNTGKSRLEMNGYAKNFLSLLNVSPDQLSLIWNVHSSSLHLEDYKGFLKKQKTEEQKNKKAVFRETTSQIDKMLVDGKVELNITADKMDYKKFDATDVRAKILLASDIATIHEVSMNHAKGQISLSGSLKDDPGLNNVVLTAKLNKIDLPTIFHSFSDFGQDAISEKNIKGQITAYIKLNTDITDQATVIRDNNRGTIDFLIENGELNNFEPIQKVSEKVFKKQDFSQIRFADLQNQLIVKGTSFSFERMEIRSTALTMFVKGVYDIKNGTDMSITLPVRNLLKSNANVELSDEGKGQKGISIRLRAQTGDNGKLKIAWDPLRKGGRKL